MNDPMKALVEVAPTLAELKRLPMERKCRLLLARLEFIGRAAGALNKHNLMMVRDPYGLSVGYLEAERDSVREHLLGAPWTRLVNDGYLVDILGQGFYKVSDEGKEYLSQAEVPRQVELTSALSPQSTTNAPRAFLSYSWDDSEHKRWVSRFAERLQAESGVEITFDAWHLSPGDDRLHFMERSISESNFVIVVCTPTYADRANTREGGVGFESMIITAEMADQILTSKFIPVLRTGSWKSSMPIYLKSRMGVDLRAEPYSEEEYEKLLRKLHAEPIQPPPVGTKPDFSKKYAANSPHVPPTSKNEFASVELRKGNKVFQGIATQSVIGEIQNISTNRRIREYSVTLTVPRLALSFSSTYYVLEIPSQDPDFRRFRSSEQNWGKAQIFPGDRLQIISIELAVGQLSEEDRLKCLKMPVMADAIVDGEALHFERPVSEYVDK